MPNFAPFEHLSVMTRRRAPVVITESRANFKPYGFRAKSRAEIAKDAFDIAVRHYDGMSVVFDRNPSDENFEKLKRLYERRETLRQEYEEILLPIAA